MARGGWRYGAGRAGSTIKAEQALRLDVRELAARGLLGGGVFTLRWSNTYTGDPAGSIGVSTAPAAMRLSFAIDGDPRVQTVPILRTPCNYGGTRPWLACPRCHRRVAVIYLRGGLFLCRHCNRVAYTSQSEDEVGRSWLKQGKLEARLGKNWRRPKGMHRATRARVVAAIIQCEEAREMALAAYLARVGLLDDLFR